MDAPSSDGVEILSTGARPSTSTRPPKNRDFDGNELNGAAGSAAASSKRSNTLTDVIELGDSSDEDDVGAGGRLADDGLLVVGVNKSGPVACTKRSAPTSSSSDDLLPASALWAKYAPAHASTSAQAMGRSASMTVGTSAAMQSAALARSHSLSSAYDYSHVPSSSPHLAGLAQPLVNAPAFDRPLADRFAATRNALFTSSSPHAHVQPPVPQRGSSLFLAPDVDEDEDDVDLMPAPAPALAPAAKPRKAASAAPTRAEEDDPWADILLSPGKGKGKGKKVAEGAGARKRSVSAAVEDEPVAGPSKKAPRLSADFATAGSSTAAPAVKTASIAGLSKTALKKLETADRVRLREANTLRAGDKKVSTAELTVHLSGRAFSAALAAGEPEVDDVAAVGKKRARQKAPKSSPWLEISRELVERLKLYRCDVECPEPVRSGSGAVLDVEGAVRWTRVCDRAWSEERRMFLPLQESERVVVEEDSRLIFLTAHDLSTHVANGTLSAHIASLQSALPPHSNLFILLYGLASLFRDLERARQEAYRNSIRAGGGDGAEAAKAAKPAGIGERQPSKDELELELMRVQVRSRCMIVSVDKVAEAVDWLEQLTFDVGQKPYQRLKHSHQSVLGTSEDKVVSGKDLQDTYIKMLASLPHVTEPVAKGIVAEYPTWRDLFEAWGRCRDERERREMLVGIGKGRNVNGTATHRAIGKDLSGNIYRILTGRNPNMFI
ncbi:hypothetical protein Rhopal_000191-T1 [Rhodotorula paludigena]|uniref:ERCC4 domain-containing protein n=1 Tax=Rhodotorula paludigena TaxID=86838 RepID=A0AAV5G4C8_9BASI|nr:hypothetical protein Rhopal_000191-T1 [Rhodotorula paludigena]